MPFPMPDKAGWSFRPARRTILAMAGGAALLLASIAVACQSTRPTDAPPAVIAVDPAQSSAAPIASDAPAPPAEPVGADKGVCAGGFVEVIDGSKTVRYALGREIVAGVRGATYAFIEEVIHQNGTIVLHLEGLANADSHGGHLSLSVMDFREPTSLPAVFEGSRAVYQPLGLDAERDERHLQVRVAITSWGPEGSWIEGTFGPSTSAPIPTQTTIPLPRTSGSVSSPPRASSSFSSYPARSGFGSAWGSAWSRPPTPPRPVTPYRGRFRVCRTADWRVRL